MLLKHKIIMHLFMMLFQSCCFFAHYVHLSYLTFLLVKKLLAVCNNHFSFHTVSLSVK